MHGGFEIPDLEFTAPRGPRCLSAGQFLRDIEMTLFAILSTCYTRRLMNLNNSCVSLCKSAV